MTAQDDYRGRDRARRRSWSATARAPRWRAIAALRSGGGRSRSARPSPGPAAIEQTATRLANMSVDESGMGSREPTRRAKVLGILRDALRQKSMGIIEEDPGGHRQVREARRRDRVADPGDQPVRHAGRHRHLRDQVQGRGDLLAASGQPEDDRSRPCALMRAALRKQGAPEDILQVRRAAEHPAGQRADGDLRSRRSPRAARRWSRPRTAPASPPTASAPATRRW